MDTSVLIEDPEWLKDPYLDIRIPMRVIRQLDGLKDSDKSKVRWNSRQASNLIDELSIPTLQKKEFIQDLGNQADNEIIGAAILLKKEYPDERIILFSTDINMLIVARTYGIEAVDPFKL